MKDLGCRDFEMRTLSKKGEMDTSNLPFETQYFLCTVLTSLRYLDDFLFYPYFIPL